MVTEDESAIELSGFRVHEQLGRGGSGAVFRATQLSLDRTVALKLLHDCDPSVLHRFRREAQVLSRVSHPNIVALYAFDATEPPYIAMEYVPGGTLRQRIVAAAAGNTIDLPFCLRLARELLTAVAVLHQKKLLHRDIKPQNVFLRQSGEAVLGDLGLARCADPAVTRFTQTGVIVGTAAYLPPEVYEGAELGQAADLFAIGLVLFETLTGVHPSGHKLLVGHTYREQMKLLEGPEIFCSLIRDLLEPDPARRPTARQALARLDSRGQRDLTKTSGAARPVVKSWVRIASTLVVLALALGLWMHQPREQRPVVLVPSAHLSHPRTITHETGKPILTIGGGQIYQTGLSALAYSPDGKQVASSGLDQLLQIWDVETGNRLFRMKGPTAHKLLWTESDVLLGSSSRRLVRFNLKTQTTETLWNSTNRVLVPTLLSLLPGGTVACGMMDRAVLLLQPGARPETRPLWGESQFPVAVSPSGEIALRQNANQEVEIKRIADGSTTGRFRGSPECSSVLTGRFDGPDRLWLWWTTTTNPYQIVELWTRTAMGNWARATPVRDRKLSVLKTAWPEVSAFPIAILPSAGSIARYRLTGVPPVDVEIHPLRPGQPFSFEYDQEAPGQPGDAISRAFWTQTQTPNKPHLAVFCLSSDNASFAVGSPTHPVVCSNPSGRGVHPLGHRRALVDIDLSRDGHHLAGVDGDGRVTVWSVDTGRVAPPRLRLPETRDARTVLVSGGLRPGITTMDPARFFTARRHSMVLWCGSSALAIESKEPGGTSAPDRIRWVDGTSGSALQAIQTGAEAATHGSDLALINRFGAGGVVLSSPHQLYLCQIDEKDEKLRPVGPSLAVRLPAEAKVVTAALDDKDVVAILSKQSHLEIVRLTGETGATDLAASALAGPSADATMGDVSADGRQAVLATPSGVQFVNLRKGVRSPVQRVVGTLTAVAATGSGAFLGTKVGDVLYMAEDSPGIAHMIGRHDCPILALSASEDHRRVAALDAEGRAMVWNR
jgi:serine/threonine protein kinase